MNVHEDTQKQIAQMKTEKLYFVVDKSFARGNQVYSGHSGTGRKFQMHMSDYGKYAMIPSTKEVCEKLIQKIEKDAKSTTSFDWEIVPMTQIDLCNFYEDIPWNHDAYYKLKKEQQKLK